MWVGWSWTGRCPNCTSWLVAFKITIYHNQSSFNLRVERRIIIESEWVFRRLWLAIFCPCRGRIFCLLCKSARFGECHGRLLWSTCLFELVLGIFGEAVLVFFSRLCSIFIRAVLLWSFCWLLAWLAGLPSNWLMDLWSSLYYFFYVYFFESWVCYRTDAYLPTHAVNYHRLTCSFSWVQYPTLQIISLPSYYSIQSAW